MELPIPTQEVIVDQEVVTEDERHIHADFFDGRPSKTLERYLKIRNYILDYWQVNLQYMYMKRINNPNLNPPSPKMFLLVKTQESECYFAYLNSRDIVFKYK